VSAEIASGDPRREKGAAAFPEISDLPGMVLTPGAGAMIIAVFAPKTAGLASVNGYDVHYHVGRRAHVEHVPDGLTFEDSAPQCPRNA